MPSLADDAGWKFARELKRDVFGRVELLTGPGGACVRRVACGNGWPGTGLVARWLLARERRALQALAGLAGVPQVLSPRSVRGELLRSWCAGEPLWSVQELPLDFFDRLRELVVALHTRGVCHNDLHKENNILLGRDGRPAVTDFQLASVHTRRSASFARRCAEDLRHVEKHRRRYDEHDLDRRRTMGRLRVAALWYALVKPVYNILARKLLRHARGEPRRPRDGSWPRRTPPVGSGSVRIDGLQRTEDGAGVVPGGPAPT